MFSESNPSLRDARKAETREALLVAARDLLEREGYEGTSLRAVARAAGVSPATAVFHFGDKPGMLHAALFDALDAELRAALAELPRSGPVRPWLVALVGRFFAYYARRPALSKAQLRHSLLADGEWAQRFRGQYEVLGAEVMRRLAAEVAAGRLPGTLDLGVATAAFFSFYVFLLVDAAQAGFEGLDARLALLDRLLQQQLGDTPSESPAQEPAP